jgi:hypothetical protein
MPRLADMRLASMPSATAATQATNRARTTPRAKAWAKLLARVGEELPLECPNCGGDIRLIAFITEPGPIRKILTHLGEPLEPPPVSPARGPPTDWDAVCADARKTPSQGDARRFGEPPPDGRNAQSRCSRAVSRAVRQPEDRCGSAIDRAILRALVAAQDPADHKAVIEILVRYPHAATLAVAQEAVDMPDTAKEARAAVTAIEATLAKPAGTK